MRGPNLEKLKATVPWMPPDEKEWRRARDDWKRAILRSNTSPAGKLVGLALADQFICRKPGHPLFNWAWPSAQTLAAATGLTRRTVTTQIDELESRSLIVVIRSTRGRGQSNRYTLRFTHLESLQQETLRADTGGTPHCDAENENALRNFRPVHEQCSVENGDIETGNARQEKEKQLLTTPTLIRKESFERDRRPIELTPAAASQTDGACQHSGVGSAKWKPRRRWEPFATAQDQQVLAKALGNGNEEEGWNRLLEVGDERRVNVWAWLVRQRRMSLDQFREAYSAFMTKQTQERPAASIPR